MYADAGFLHPYFQNFFQEQQLEEFCYSQKPNSSLENIIHTSDYDFGGEGNLFEAPEPVIEEPTVNIDPMTAPIAMISCGDDVMHQPVLKDIESLQNKSLLSDVFDGCKNQFLEKTSTVSDVFDIKFPFAIQTEDSESLCDLSFTESQCGSSESLSSLEWTHANGCDINLVHSSLHRPFVSVNEDRFQKLSRYRNKKSRRNFGRKIKYACRKALADCQPRIRGRFAKTDSCKSQQQSSTSGSY